MNLPEVTETKNLITHSYPSLKAFADYNRANQTYRVKYRAFNGADSITEACDRAERGLPETGLRVLSGSRALSDNAMRQVSAFDMQTAHDVAGAYVDMGRFVTGEPECMVDALFTEQPVTRPVITIVSNVNASGAVSKEDLEARGRLVVALIKAIETSGRTTELYVDSTNIHKSVRDHSYRIKVRVKAASQPLDMGAVMYAFSDCDSIGGFAVGNRAASTRYTSAEAQKQTTHIDKFSTPPVPYKTCQTVGSNG